MKQYSTTYRTIFRLDYPILYTLLDSLGVYAQYFQDHLSTIKGAKYEVNLNLAHRAINSTVHVESTEERFVCKFTLNSLILDVNFPKGYTISKLAQHESFKFINNFVKELSSKGLKNYSRIGFRNFFVQECPDVGFNDILSYILSCNEEFTDAIKNDFPSLTDTGLTIEARNEEGAAVRTSFGPYQESESQKYFAFKSPISEGLIADIDI